MSAADYGNNGKWMLLGCSIFCWASQFAAMSLLGTFLYLPCVQSA